MCSLGVDACEGAASKGTLNDRKAFTTCCWNTTDVITRTAIFDGDKVEFTGCRCDGWALPPRHPQDYVVPPSTDARYNSTGECVCMYMCV
jgi:hypothetical protein